MSQTPETKAPITQPQTSTSPPNDQVRRDIGDTFQRVDRNPANFMAWAIGICGVILIIGILTILGYMFKEKNTGKDFWLLVVGLIVSIVGCILLVNMFADTTPRNPE